MQFIHNHKNKKPPFVTQFFHSQGADLTGSYPQNKFPWPASDGLYRWPT